MTKTFKTQAACLALALVATVGTVTGVDAIAAQQCRTAQAQMAGRTDGLQVAAAQTVVVVARRVAKA
jgi:hypothetical protein